MSELTPALAEKVLAANLRNVVKKVSDGGTLGTPERQIFLGMAEGNLSPAQIREKRIVALVRKHMDGGRLSAAEKDEVAHLLEDASSIIDTPSVPVPSPVGLSEEEVKKFYELSRAKYFRWRQVGQAVAEGPDLPPFEDPKAMVAWYERMRSRGLFKHRLPKRLMDLASKGFASIETKGTADPKPNLSSSAQPGNAPPREAPEKRGFMVEHEKLEEHTAILREDYLDAYARNDVENGNLLKQRYFEAYEMLRKSATQKEAIGLEEKSLAKKEDVEEDLGQIIPAIVANLVSERFARGLFDSLQLEPKGVIFAEFFAALRKHQIENFESMKKSRFAPPLIFDPS